MYVLVVSPISVPHLAMDDGWFWLRSTNIWLGRNVETNNTAKGKTLSSLIQFQLDN